MMVLMLIECMLANLGCESVATAATVGDAVALTNGQAFDVAMLDINLYGRKSDPVADALIARGVPFVFCTGNVGYSMRNDLRERPLLSKPYRQSDLATVLTRLLSEPPTVQGGVAA